MVFPNEIYRAGAATIATRSLKPHSPRPAPWYRALIARKGMGKWPAQTMPRAVSRAPEGARAHRNRFRSRTLPAGCHPDGRIPGNAGPDQRPWADKVLSGRGDGHDAPVCNDNHYYNIVLRIIDRSEFVQVRVSFSCYQHGIIIVMIWVYIC